MKRMNDTNRRKQQILQTAEQIFSENGYQQTSIEKIADACGLVKGTVLHYFGSKEKLYQAVLQTRRKQSVDYLQAALLEKDKSVREILQTALELCRTQFLANSSFSKEYVEQGMKQSFVEMRIPVYEGLATIFEQLIFRGVETGELQVRDPQLCAQAVAFAIFGITNFKSTPDRMWEEIKEVLETMLGLCLEERGEQ